MGIVFTKDQQAVIDHQEGNLLVSAAAGSGKTAVLVERIIQMLLREQDPVPIDQILVLTFTNAAARQMKEKIEARLQQALEIRPEDPFLEEQYHSLTMASIMTNHAFCLQILQDYITRIPDLDPGFRVADETEMALLKLDVLANVLEEFYSEALSPELSQKSEDFLSLIDAYGGSRQDSQIEDLLLQVYAFMENDPKPLAWLDRAVEQLNPDHWQEAGENIWMQLAAAQIETELTAAAAMHQNLTRILTEAGAQALAEKFQAAIEELSEQQTVKAQALAAKKLAWPRMSYAAFKEDPQQEQQVKQLLGQMKESFKRAASLAETFWSQKTLDRMRTLTFPAMRGMRAVLQAFDKAYTKKKREKNLVEFSDFEHGALAILEDESVAADLIQHYRYIYIDEYQDSNRLQEAIIERIARRGEDGQPCNVFMVGDVKQSIYRFRQADPSLFLEKYETYGTTPHTKKLVLGQNFRSERPVLAAVNFIFEAIMHKESAELEYGEAERLYPAKPENDEAKAAELWVLETDPALDSRQQSEREAKLVADEIERLIQQGASYRDIVILMRSVSTQGEIYRKALEKRGIPAYAESSENFYDTQEIRTMMNLLHVLDNPRQDIPLMGVLYSPIAGFTEAELGMVRLAAPEADFYEALQIFAAQEMQDLCHQKAQDFMAKLARWRELARFNRVHDLLWRLYVDTGYYLYASSMPGGRVRKANLDLLLEKSIAFEKGIYSGLYQFLRYVEKLDRYRKSQDEAKILSEEENLVRIMTIHKSKGLEFPVVFAVGLGRKWNTRDVDGKILLHQKWGIGAAVIDSKRYVRYPSMTTEILKNELLKEMTAEEMRLLYVAMTRAQSRLFLVGSRKPKEEVVQPAADWRMETREVLQARTYLEWVEKVVSAKAGSPLIYRVWQLGCEDEKAKEQEKTSGQQEAKEETRCPKSMSEQELDQAFSWEYSQLWKSNIPVRLSVSQIKSRQMAETAQEPEEAKAFFVEAEENQAEGIQKTRGADRGTAFHTVMAQADWNSFQDADKLEKEVQRLLQEGRLSKEEEKILERSWIRRFADSDLYRRMLWQETIYLEKPFMMSIPLRELASFAPQLNYGADEQPMMIQGMIDCYFYEDGGWVLVDYKTDRTLDEQRLSGYRTQLALYAQALENATGISVKQRLIYDVRRGKEIIC